MSAASAMATLYAPGTFGVGTFPDKRPAPKIKQDSSWADKAAVWSSVALAVATLGALVIGALAASGHLNLQVVSGYAIGLGALGIAFTLFSLKSGNNAKTEYVIYAIVAVVFATSAVLGGLALGGILPKLAPAIGLMSIGSVGILGTCALLSKARNLAKAQASMRNSGLKGLL